MAATLLPLSGFLPIFFCREEPMETREVGEKGKVQPTHFTTQFEMCGHVLQRASLLSPPDEWN
jgi:hypothetical protein